MIVDYEKKLKEIIASCRDGIDANEIVLETDLVKDYEYDSISIIQLVVRIENVFNVIVDDEDLLIERLSSFSYLKGMLERKIGQSNE